MTNPLIYLYPRASVMCVYMYLETFMTSTHILDSKSSNDASLLDLWFPTTFQTLASEPNPRLQHNVTRV